MGSGINLRGLRMTPRYKVLGDGAAIVWKVYPVGTTLRDIQDSGDFTEPHMAEYGGCTFARQICLRETSTRVLATQFVGLDI